MSKFDFSIQIENIDDDLEIEAEEKIAVELNECNNYLVLSFDDVFDWEKALNVLNVERVSTCDNNKNIRRYGIGRVIDGKSVIDKIEVKE